MVPDKKKLRFRGAGSAAASAGFTVDFILCTPLFLLLKKMNGSKRNFY